MNQLLTFSLIIFLLSTSLGFSQSEVQQTEIQQLITSGDKIIDSSPDSAYLLFQQALELADRGNDASGKAYANLKLGELFHNLQQNEEALQYLAQALNTFKLLNDSSGIADVFLNFGRIYYDFDDYIKALKYVRDAGATYPKSTSLNKLGHVNHALCDIYFKTGNIDIALKSCLSGLRAFEEESDQSCIVRVKNSLGEIYLDINQLTNARKNFFEALNLANSLGNNRELASSYIKVGELYFSEELYEEAIRYFNNALLINRQRQDKLGLANTYLSIGKANIKLNEFDKAVRSLEEGLKLSKEIGARDVEARSLLNIGMANFGLDKKKEAIENLKQALRVATRINARPILRDCYQNLAILYNETGDKENAFLNYNLYVRQNEAIYTQESAQRIAETEALYNIEQKENEITLLKKENEIQALRDKERTYIVYGLILFSVLIVTLIIVLYSRYRLKSKSNDILKIQKSEIEEAKDKIEEQKNDIEEKSLKLNEINLQLTDSIKYARRIQESILPETSSLNKYFSDSFVFYKPKDIVSGDFYWVKEIDDVVIIALADCTGHGVPGAFMTVLGNTLLNQIVKEGKLTDPSLILTMLDQLVRQSLHQDERDDQSYDGMDMAICSYFKKEGILKFSGAHLPLYFSNNGTLEQFKANRYPVGSKQFKEKQFQTTSLEVNKGDVLFLASDGFQDQFGGKEDKKFMKAKFRAFLASIYHLPLSQQYSKLNDAFYSWKNGNEQTDDVLVVGVKV